MNSLQAEYDDLQSGCWAEISPVRCPCRGKGWLLSDLDTWHKCPRHGGDAPCPGDGGDGEDDDGSSPFGADAHWVKNMQDAFVAFRGMARENGFTGDNAAFEAACMADIGTSDKSAMNPSLWVEAAEAVALWFENDEEEAEARRFGFSCASEMHSSMDEEARLEGEMRVIGW